MQSYFGVNASPCELVHELCPSLLVLCRGDHCSCLQVLKVLQASPYSAVIRRNCGGGGLGLLFGVSWAFNVLADCTTLTARHS